MSAAVNATDEILAGRSLAARFARGELEQVIAAHIRKPATADAERAAVVGAYAWSGRLDEARALHARFDGRAAATYREPARCWLAVGLCHAGDLAAARGLLAAARATPLPLGDGLRYYRLHARAFVAYFRGRMARSIRLGRRALRVAIAHDNAFGQLLSNDLLGHACVHLGMVRRGQRLLGGAALLAAELGLSHNRLNLMAAQHIIAVGAAPDDDDAVASLTRLLREPNLGFFTRRHGHIALAIAGALRGDLIMADDARRAAAGFAVLADSRGKVRARCAEACVAAVRGERDAARRAFAAAIRLAERGRHVELQAEVGFLQRLLLDACLPSSSAAARRDGARWRWAHGATLAPEAEHLDDDLLLAAVTGRLPRALAGLAAAALPPGDVIALSTDAVVVRGRDGVTAMPAPPSASARLLIELGRGPRSRAELVAAMYGIKGYHPAIHNGALYTAVSRVRRAFGVQGDWIESTSDGYRLRPGVQVVVRDADAAATAVATPVASNAMTPRQKALAATAGSDGATCAEVARRCGMSPSTALRILRDLVSDGQVRRLGSAAQTRYVASP